MKTQMILWVAFLVLLMAGALGVVPLAWYLSDLYWEIGLRRLGHIMAVLGSILIYVLVWVGLVELVKRNADKEMKK